jgi:hypothetical protein
MTYDEAVTVVAKYLDQVTDPVLTSHDEAAHELLDGLGYRGLVAELEWFHRLLSKFEPETAKWLKPGCALLGYRFGAV